MMNKKTNRWTILALLSGICWLLPSSGHCFCNPGGQGDQLASGGPGTKTISRCAAGSTAKANPFRFCTKYQDDGTDLPYYGYRYLNTSTGGWLSRDPIEEKGGPNLYGFVANDAVSKVDSSGLTAHLAPANDIIINSSSYEVFITGDWIEISLHTFGRGTAYAYPWSESEKAKILLDVPAGTTAGIKEDGGPHILKPGHNSTGDWVAHLTRIVDADFMTGAAVPIYTDSRCCNLLKSGYWVKPTRWTHVMPIALTVYDCANKKAVYYKHGREYKP